MISKSFAFVILLVVVALVPTGCNRAPSQTTSKSPANGRKPQDYASRAAIIGRIESPEITESSGITNSRCKPDLLWTLNDSGNDNIVFALSKKGRLISRWRVTGARNVDWEDMASFRDKSGRCFLYLGDTGNNSLARKNLKIYKIPEPDTADREIPGIESTAPAELIRYSYPDGHHNAEALMVHPVTEAIYVITKRVSGAAGVYKITGPGQAQKIAEISLPSVPRGLLTGGDIDPTGTRVIICDYFGGYEFVLPEGEKDFDKIWKQEPRSVDLGNRSQGEAVAYSADGRSVFATSENAKSPILEARRK